MTLVRKPRTVCLGFGGADQGFPRKCLVHRHHQLVQKLQGSGVEWPKHFKKLISTSANNLRLLWTGSQSAVTPSSTKSSVPSVWRLRRRIPSVNLVHRYLQHVASSKQQFVSIARHFRWPRAATDENLPEFTQNRITGFRQTCVERLVVWFLFEELHSSGCLCLNPTQCSKNNFCILWLRPVAPHFVDLLIIRPCRACRVL